MQHYVRVAVSMVDVVHHIRVFVNLAILEDSVIQVLNITMPEF